MNMTKQNRRRWRVILILLVPLLLTVFVYGGMIRRIDLWAADAMYQHAEALDGDVLVIGIDERALDEFGPYSTWDRSIMTRALRTLNSDENKKPAVVAIDTLYSGTTDEKLDTELSEAAADLGCVITAASAEFGQVLSRGGNGYTLDTYAISAFEESYPGLKAVTAQGHINAMYDTDGIMRHALLYIEPEEGKRVYSMAEQAAELYLGRTPDMPRTDSRGIFYVPFSAKPGDFYEGISIADLVDGTVEPDRYAGRIVLIGPYAAGLQDAIYTPIARAEQMYGVEFQANVIQAFLDGSFKGEVPDIWQALLLYVVLVLLFAAFMRLSVPYASLAGAAAVICGILLSMGIYRTGWIVHPLWLPFGAGVLYAVGIIWHYFQTRMEKQAVTRTFERYVDPEIVNEILREGTESLSLGGKLCDIAVLFVDIRGFTTMSENMAPETVVKILNKYLNMTSACVHRYGGTLDKFVGDATMAFWGAPLPHENPVFAAVKTARDIIRGAEAVSEELKDILGGPLRVGVGVNYGPAVVGNIGAESRMDFTAIGDTVNTSARLEANAPGGTVYISKSVVDALEGRIRATSLGTTIKLKGKADGFEIFTLDDIIE